MPDLDGIRAMPKVEELVRGLTDPTAPVTYATADGMIVPAIVYRPDPATAHLVRMTRNAARLMHHLSPRIVVHLHGSCIGSGIELPAFATKVVAKPDTAIALPEVRLGLIPGAGGTVSPWSCSTA